MSINTTPNDLKDTDNKKGHVAQGPPIPYVLVTSRLKTSMPTESIKVKLTATGYLICLEVFEDRDYKMYLKQLIILQRLQATKGVEEKLLLATEELKEKNKILKTLRKSHTMETREAKQLHLMEVSAAKSQVIEQQTVT